MGSERFTIRPAVADDIGQMSGVLQRAGLSSGGPELLRFNLASPGTQMFVASDGGRVIGVACGVCFGRTGWLGNVAVEDDARGQGLGRVLSQTAVDVLREAGAQTVLLTATKLGQPIYERLGFTDEGVSYGIWERDAATEYARDRSATARPAGIDDVLGQDIAATGEDRRSYLVPFADRARVPAGPGRASTGRAGPGRASPGRASTGRASTGRASTGRASTGRASTAQAGYWIGLPWGGGPIVAASPASARPLIVEMIQASPGSRLAFPEVNAHGAALAVSLGFHLARSVRRMRLGPPVAGYKPRTIYNVYSLGIG